jgi:hypothetical protein
MKSILYILCALFLSSTYTFAAKYTKEEREVIAVASVYPASVAALVTEYPHLEKELIESAQRNSDKIRARKRKPPAKLKTEIAKERNWRNFACLEKNSNQRELRSETKTPWPDQCSKWVSEDSDNPATTNSAQTEANGYGFAFEQGLITRQQAQQGIDNITRNGSVIVDPLPPSGS